MSKKSGLIGFFVIMALSGYGQNSKIGYTMSLLSDNSLIRFKPVMDDASYEVGSSIAFGATYLNALNNWLELETGVEYIRCQASSHSIIPGYSEYYHTSSVSLISLPVGVKAGFWKYCFVNGGVLLDFDVSENSPIDGQTGLGVLLGTGLMYDFKTGISLFVNPYIKAHSLISVSMYDGVNHLIESAVRFGVTYKLK